MYNMLQKQSYIEFYQSKVSTNYIAGIFHKTKLLEEHLSRDVSEFSKDEIIQMLKKQNSTSMETLRYRISLLRSYTNWCIHSGHYFGFNQYNFISSEDLLSCIDQHYRDSKFISREILNQYVSDLINPCDKFLLLAFYDGIRGKNFIDISYMKGDDINVNTSTVRLQDGTIISVSQDLVVFAKQSANEYNYYITKEFEVTCVGLKEVSEILKPRTNSCNNSEQSRYNRISKTMLRLKEILDAPNLTIPRLFNSGIVNRLLIKSQELSIPPMKLLVSQDFIEERKFYGLDGKQDMQLRHMFKEYLIEQ